MSTKYVFTIDQVKDLYKDQVLRAQKRYKKFIKNPTSPKRLIKLRVSTRQARSILSFFKPLVDKEGRKATNKFFASMSKDLSRVRNLDALAESWDHAKKDFNLSKDMAKALDRQIKKERKIHLARALDKLDRPRVREDFDHILAWVESWEDLDGKDLGPFLIRRFDKWIKVFFQAYQDLDFGDYKQIHALRLRLKKIRIVQAKVDLIQGQSDLDLKRIKKALDDLGYVTDYYASLALLKDLESKSPDLEDPIKTFKTYLDKERLENLEKIKAY